MAAQTRQSLSPGLKGQISIQQQQQQQQQPQQPEPQHKPPHPLPEHTYPEDRSVPPVEDHPESSPADKMSDDCMKSVSSSPPTTPSEPPSLDLATPTPSQTASPTRCEDQYEKPLMNYETEKNVYTSMNNDTPSNTDHNDNSSANHTYLFDPTQTTTFDHIQSIIQAQFDLEILLKHRELRIIDDEIAKIHVMMLQIKRTCENPRQAIASHEPKGFAEFYTQYLDSKSLLRSGSHSTPRYLSATNTRSKHDSLNYQTSSLYPPKILRSSSFSSSLDNPSTPQTRNNLFFNQPVQKSKCVIRRNDGVLVRLVCPKCARENFGSAQGFINHCRISHALEYTTHDVAAIVCGVEVDEQDEVGLEAQRQNAEKAASNAVAPTSVSESAGAVETPAGISLPLATPIQAVNNTSTTPAIRQHFPYIPCGVEAISTKNLSLLVKKRRKGQQDIDVYALAKTSVEKFAKGHLLDEEEEDEDVMQELGEEATPFERALAEAKKLKLDVDEIRRTAPVPSTAMPSTSKPGRKKRGGARGRRGSSRVSSAAATVQRSQFAPAPPTPPATRSVSAEGATPRSTLFSPATGTSATVGGKYRPGFAPSHWNLLNSNGNEGDSGKTFPGQAEKMSLSRDTPTPTPSQQRRLPSSISPKVTRSKTRKTELAKTERAKSDSLPRSMVKRKLQFNDDEDDEGHSSPLNDDEMDYEEDEGDDAEEDEEEDDDDDDDDDDGDNINSNTVMKKRRSFSTTAASSYRHHRSTGKTLPGSHPSSSGNGLSSSGSSGIDSLQKFVPLSRFF